MKKTLTLILLAIFSFGTTFATINNGSIRLSNNDILYAKIFYINGEGYVKDGDKLKKIVGTKFFKIAGQLYIKKNGKFRKAIEEKIKKINGINYVISEGKIQTLEKYLEKNNIKKTSEKITLEEYILGKQTKVKKPKITHLLKKYQIERIKKRTLEDLKILILFDNPENVATVEMLSKAKNKKEFYANLANYYKTKGKTTIAKKLTILANIEKLDIDKINRVIKAKLENKEIKFNVADNNSDDDLEKMFKDVLGEDLDDENVNNTEQQELSTNTGTKANSLSSSLTNTGTLDDSTSTSSTNSGETDNSEDEDIDDMLNELFND